MNLQRIHHCPATLAAGFDTYSKTACKRLFEGKKVYHILPYYTPTANMETDSLLAENLRSISISGVQEKFLLVLEKNQLRFARENERGTYILKPPPHNGRKSIQMPANEHLTMQIARQIYGIATAENALIFFKDGMPAYLAKRFDIAGNGTKLAQEDFAALTGKTPQTHGEHYKYTGSYLELFDVLQQYVPAYKAEAPKLLKLLIFNYLFSNGDAHLKNFSLLETPMGDYALSPAYDLLNSRIHIADSDFALRDGLLPKNLSKGKIGRQFATLAAKAGIPDKISQETMLLMTMQSDKVSRMIAASFLDESTQRNYWQAYQQRLNQLTKESVF